MTGVRGPAAPPRSLVPLPGESLPGLLLQLSHRLDQPPSVIAYRSGLVRRNGIAPPVNHLLMLAPQFQPLFASVTRIPEYLTEGLTLRPLVSRYPPVASALPRRGRQDHLRPRSYFLPNDVQGRRALGRVLRGQWFARSVRSRLLDGPGLRNALVTRLMRLAQVGDEYRLEVEMLIDLMVAVGMLQTQPDSQLRWCEDAAEVSARAEAPAMTGAEDDCRPEDNLVECADHAAGSPDTAREPAPEDPRPGESATKIPAPQAEADDSLVALLSHPLQLVDLASLSTEELLSVHGHITALAATATKLRSRPSSHPTD